MSGTQQTMGFQTEVKQMLHLVVHSLYSNKEIFLRELISNASDALDKLRFLALTDSALYENDSDLKITIDVNDKLKTITIQDNGIGLSWDEAVENLGTIAKSGTKEFMSHLTGEAAKDSQLIGQFGVGFYSAFIVADKVVVKSRRAGLKPEEGIVWESKGEGEFTIGSKKKLSRGTEIILHLKSDEDEFLSNWRLRSIISKYSDHISLPIRMKKEEWDEEKKETVIKDELETINQASALWARSKSDITDEQYIEFYKHVSHDYQDPLSWTHNRVEGRSEYTQLLYLPKNAPFDLWDRNKRGGIKLYVKRVFIMDDAEDRFFLRNSPNIIDKINFKY
jgi:molecular chaperone HtpG